MITYAKNMSSEILVTTCDNVDEISDTLTHNINT